MATVPIPIILVIFLCLQIAYEMKLNAGAVADAAGNHAAEVANILTQCSGAAPATIADLSSRKHVPLSNKLGGENFTLASSGGVVASDSNLALGFLYHDISIEDSATITAKPVTGVTYTWDVKKECRMAYKTLFCHNKGRYVLSSMCKHYVSPTLD